MWKQIREFWRGDDVMRDVVQRLVGMVNDVEYGCEHAWEVCTGQAVADKTRPELKAHDKAVNSGEREIRRLVLEHLSLHPGRDVSGCLAVVLMAKDIERIGDHARNVFDVGVRCEGGISGFQLFAELDACCRGVCALLPMLERAVRESSEPEARAGLEGYTTLKARIRALEDVLFAADIPSTREAAATALLVRYLMRINAHIGNALSAVIFPLEDIDFVSRGLRRASERE